MFLSPLVEKNLKMNKSILDASALLALINQEKGYSKVEKVLPQAIMSSVNLSEVATILTSTGIPTNDIQSILSDLIQEIIPFDSELAYQTAALKLDTQKLGLSLGDRACLSLALIYKLPVFTADQIWKKLDLPIEINLIR